MAFTLLSVAFEMVILLVLYRVVFFTILKSCINKLFATRPWWDYLTTYEGLFSKNAQVEVVYVAILMIHHFIGGLGMLYGYIKDDPVIFAHAALFELVDDIHDLMCMTFLLWPFEERDYKMLVVMGFHHIFGVIIIVPVLTSGLYMDQNLQLIGISLLLAGAVSCLGLVISRTMDRRVPTEAWMDFLMWLVNLSFFSLCRFYIFPQQLYLFLEKTNWETNYPIIASAICMVIFNLLIFMDSLNATLDRFRIALSNGEKHSFSQSCHCKRCQRLSAEKPLTAFLRFENDFEINNALQTGATSTSTAKSAWEVLDKASKTNYIEEADAQRKSWEEMILGEKSRVMESNTKNKIN